MLPATSPRKKLKSPGQDTFFNPKTTITCTNVPESLFETDACLNHFSKFGKVEKIRLFPKKRFCAIEYEQPSVIEKAVLNAGAYDGFMFDVTRAKTRVRRRSKREDDPDWLPDSDVAQELSAMRGAPTYNIRNKSKVVEPETAPPKPLKRVIQQIVRKPLRKPQPAVRKAQPAPVQSTSGTESPVIVTTQTTMTTFEAASELHQLRSKISLSADEQWRTLDARDRILRSWGGAGSKVKVGGATIGTCQEMCPEKELLHRQAEHQVMILETDTEGVLEPRRAVKQYSRSSADQEMPMCYELRPARVLSRTCAYLLHEVADTNRQISLADWFHFMWDRLRGIRKDITQQALCCAESICLVEMCARFHAHCAARLADLEHTQFDQKLNTDNLTKCLQTLKHMYNDVTADKRPREAEFRGYIALLNLGDANFWWEIKQLPEEIQKSEPLIFAIKVFNALDNNNYVRFFRLVREHATYLQACILLRYFNDVRARALARIVKSYAPRGGSRFPASDLVSALAFESIDKMKAFISHYGLRFAKSDDELSVILDRHQFIEDSDPFPTARALQLIESKRKHTIGQVIAGGQLPNAGYFDHNLHKSFTNEGRLKETALVAEEQGFDTVNDSNKNVQALKMEIQRLANGGKPYAENAETKTPFLKSDIKTANPRRQATVVSAVSDSKHFIFKPAITVAPTEVIENSPEKVFESNDVFSFSNPQVTDKTVSFFTPPASKSHVVFNNKTLSEPKIFGRTSNANKEPFQNSQNVFGGTNHNMTKNTEPPKSSFSLSTIDKPKTAFDSSTIVTDKSVFGQNAHSKQDSAFSGTTSNDNLFSKPKVISNSVFKQNIEESNSAFGPRSNDNIFSNPDIPQSLFGQKVLTDKQLTFSGGTKPIENVFSKPGVPKSVFGQNFVELRTENHANVFGIKPSAVNNTNDNRTTSTKNIFAIAKGDTTTSKSDSAAQFGKESNIFAKAASNSEESRANSIFTKPMQNKNELTSKNIFAHPAPDREESKHGGNIFARLGQNSGETKQGHNIFSKSAPVEESNPTSIFGAENKSETKNIFAKPAVTGEQNPPSIFSNGVVSADKMSPGSLFKTAVNPPNGPDAKSYSLFPSKNKAQTVADSIFNSLNAAKNDSNSNVYDFNPNTEIDEQKQLELQRLREEKIKQEEERQRLEILRKKDEAEQAELRKQKEEKRRAEEKRKQAELRLLEERRRLEEKRRLEEQRIQEELRKKLEEERKAAELKRKAEEKHRKFLEAVDIESTQLVEEILTEVNNETSRDLLQVEQENYRQLLTLANNTTEDVITELCNEIYYSEMKAEAFLTRHIMRKWFDVWRRQLIRNLTRRKWLDDTPVWLPNRSPIEQASQLRRKVEDATLKNMNAFHRGYIFTGELNQLPAPEPYNIMEIIRSPLLKRMKQINYPYDKCFFWKVTLVSPGKNQWLSRKINVEKWLYDAFSDKNSHPESETLLHVTKQSWNHLMDFAISVSLANRENANTLSEAVEGTNSVLFYSTETDTHLLETIEQTLKNKYPYQVIPVAVIMPKQDDAIHNAVQTLLAEYVNREIISGYKVFVLDSKNINKLINTSTKTALKWMAKKYPQTPPLEIDLLKSICQRYLGNEIWCKLRSERDSRMDDVLKDLQKLVNCYNVAVDKLTDVITDEDLFNYTPFPLELKPNLEQASPYPKPYEFITDNVRTSENISTIRDIMKQLKLPNSLSAFRPLDASSMQQQVQTYCNQIGWFENPEEVLCKVVAVLPNELSNPYMTCEDFTQCFVQYDLVDFLNVIIYEKINRLYNFDNRFAIYKKSLLQDYCNFNWLYEVKTISDMKHKAIDYEDDEVNTFITAKRRKLAMDSLEYLMLEDKDSTLVESSIQIAEADITKYSDCSEAVKQLEKEIEEGTKKSVELENILRAALADV